MSAEIVLFQVILTLGVSCVPVITTVHVRLYFSPAVFSPDDVISVIIAASKYRVIYFTVFRSCHNYNNICHLLIDIFTLA